MFHMISLGLLYFKGITGIIKDPWMKIYIVRIKMLKAFNKLGAPHFPRDTAMKICAAG